MRIFFKVASIFTMLVTSFVVVGCAGESELVRSAQDADRQVASLEQEIGAEAKAESEFYDKAVAQLVRTKLNQDLDDATDLLTRDARAFASSHPNGDKGIIDATAAALLTSQFAADYQTRYDSRTKDLANATTALKAARKQIDAATAKLDDLRAKLKVLSTTPTNDEMYKFIATFATDVAKSVNAQKEQNDAARKSSDQKLPTAPKTPTKKAS